ncbi:hypothetical protein [uncultured Legionella sp.]|uniref:hypothetical protein n=1 Tax=uncultured Legionella sp. TaxID=210934 RepID=UPI0026204032|nr:hypothetical protein [uncultured Legionella sp.]
MIRLEELLYSLTTVIIRYHDSLTAPLVSASNKTEMHLKSRELATSIIKEPALDFKLRLNEIIQNCTNGYQTRRPFLNFMLNEIVMLHSFLSKKEPFSAQELIEYKAQIFKLLMDVKGLLETPKSKTYPVTQHTTTMNSEGVIALSGCKNDGYTGNEFCNSGIFLKEEILATLNIKISFTEDKYKEFVERICTEHQYALLVPELLEKLQKAELARDTNQQTIIELTLKSQEPQQATPEQIAESERLNGTIREQKAELDVLDDTIAELRRQLQIAQEQITVIERLNGTIREQKSELDVLAETIVELRKQLQAVPRQIAEIEQLNGTIQEQKSELDAQAKTIAELKRQLQTAPGQIAEAQRLNGTSQGQKAELAPPDETMARRQLPANNTQARRIFGVGNYYSLFHPYLTPNPLAQPTVTPKPSDFDDFDFSDSKNYDARQ